MKKWTTGARVRILFSLLMCAVCVHFSHVDGYDRFDLCYGFLVGLWLGWVVA